MKKKITINLMEIWKIVVTLLSRGLDVLFPDSPVLLRTYADFLAERPEEEDSWEVARSYYLRCIDLCNKMQQSKTVQDESDDSSGNSEKELLFTLYRFALFLTTNCNELQEAGLFI